MTAEQLAEGTRDRLVALMSDDRADGARLLARFRDIRALEGVPVCAAALGILARVDLAEDRAERLFEHLLEHRRKLSRDLGRDPGLRVCALDYLTHVECLLTNPSMVESSQLEAVRRSALTDPLTELRSRGRFERDLTTEIRRCRRHGLDLSLLMLDLDAFRAINDLYGHSFGDLVLARAARMIRRTVRECDPACRFGGEEFAVLLPETGRLGAHAVAERLRTRFAESFAARPVGGRAVTLTVSGGIASFPRDGDGVEVLISRAEQALYQSKARGRNRTTIHHSERRRAVRFPARVSTRARTRRRGQPGEQAARVVDLATGGVLLATTEPWQTADRLEVVLARSRRKWSAAGEVVRVSDSPIPEGRLVAVAFDRDLDDVCLSRNTTAESRSTPATESPR